MEDFKSSSAIEIVGSLILCVAGLFAFSFIFGYAFWLGVGFAEAIHG